MKKLLLILLCFPMIGFGQGWTQNFYGISWEFVDVQNVQQTNDLGYVFFNRCGLIKTDAMGDTIWMNQDFCAESIDDGLQTLDQGYILVGHDTLIKLDNNGIIQWGKSLQDDMSGPDAIEQTLDGGYIITGTTDLINKADEHIFATRIDSLGDTLWICYPYPHDNNFDVEGSGRDIDETSDGNYIVTGDVYILNQNLNDEPHAFLAKINNLGDTIWCKKYLFGNMTKANSVAEDSFGDFVFAGYMRDSILNDPYCKELVLVKTDPQGNIIWVKTYQTGFCGAEASSIEITNDGGYIVCGERELQSGDEQIWLLKTDNQGDTMWTQTFGNPYGYGVAAKQTIDGGYIITGIGYQSSNISYTESAMLIKVDSNGEITSRFNIPPLNYNRKLDKVVDILGRETKPQTNIPFIEIYDDGTIEKKIVVE